MKKQKRKQLRRALAWTLAAWAVALLAAMPMLAEEKEIPGVQAEILSARPEYRDVETQVAGGGQLIGQAATSVELPADVKLTQFLVENGDRVSAGDAIASVDSVSVMTAIASVQEALDYLSGQLAEASSVSTTGTVSAVSAGTVKQIYAQAGDNVQDVMLTHGALAVVSLDGMMSIRLELSDAPEPGERVTLTLPDGTEAEGTVASGIGGVLTVTVADDGYAVGAEACVRDAAGTVLGTGVLELSSPWNVTAYSGTVSEVSVPEGASVRSGQTLFRLTGLGSSADYQQLLDRHHAYEERMQELFGLLSTGTVAAPCDGIVTGIDGSGAFLLSAGGGDLTARAAAESAQSGTLRLTWLSEIVYEDAAPSEPAAGDTPEPTEPPTEPEPSNPEPTNPEPTEPEPTNPEPTEPPTEPEGWLGYAAVIVQLADGRATVRQTPDACAISDLNRLPAIRAELAAMTEERTYESELFASCRAGDTVLVVVDGEGNVVLVSPLTVDPGTEPTGPGTEPTEPMTPGGGTGGFPGGMPSGGSMGGASGGQTEQRTLYSLEKQTVASVTSQERMTLEITVDELDISEIHVGMAAYLTLDALPGQRFDAVVSRISETGTNEGGSSKFTVTLTLPKVGDMLPGMRAAAYIPLSTAENVLCVPVAALDEENGESVLYTALDEKTGTPTGSVAVTLGAADAEYVQLLSALPEETTVYYVSYSGR